MPRRTLDVLPDDVLYDILYHSSVRDILSLRQVSSKFYHLTHYRPIWVNAYKRCPILLPPGPFSYQSATDLEQALQKSHLLEANWTSPYPCLISRQTFVVPSVDSWGNHMKLVGRYLLIAGPPMLRCFDLESKTEELVPIAVYDSVESVFDCVVEKYSAVDSSDCQFLCALANQPWDNTIGAVTLLRLCVSQGSAKFEFMKDVQLPRPIWMDVRIIGDLVSMAGMYHGPMLLHIPTFQVYDVPPCDFSPDVGWNSMRSGFAVTPNHVLCYTYRESDEILEVFPLPRKSAEPNDDKEIPPVHILTRSHKCILNCDIVWSRLMLLAERHDLHNDGHSAHYTFVAMSRHIATGNRLGFLDISLESDSDLVTTAWTDATEFDSPGGISVFEGSARAGVSRLVAFNPDGEAIAFTISEDGDGKRVVRGKVIVVDMELTKLEVWNRFVFDGVQGRICHVDQGRIEVISFV